MADSRRLLCTIARGRAFDNQAWREKRQVQCNSRLFHLYSANLPSSTTCFSSGDSKIKRTHSGERCQVAVGRADWRDMSLFLTRDASKKVLDVVARWTVAVRSRTSVSLLFNHNRHSDTAKHRLHNANKRRPLAIYRTLNCIRFARTRSVAPTAIVSLAKSIDVFRLKHLSGPVPSTPNR